MYKNYFKDVSHLKPEQVCLPNKIPLNSRPLVDLVILCQALQTQGITPSIKLLPFANNRRSMNMVESGAVDTMVPSLWQTSADPLRVKQSVEVLKKGQFEKGIYVHEDHQLLQHDIKKINFNKFVGASVKSWHLDWAQLLSMTQRRIDVGYLPSLYTLLESGRADFTFLEFPTNSELVNKNPDGIRLLPIRGLKVILNDSRHFVVSTKMNQAERFITSLNAGLIALKAEQKISQLYTESGIFPKQTQDWQVIPSPTN